MSCLTYIYKDDQFVDKKYLNDHCLLNYCHSNEIYNIIIVTP